MSNTKKVGSFSIVLSILVLTGSSANPQERKRPEIKWNNPDGERPRGVEHGSFSSEAVGAEVGYNVSLPPSYAGGETRYPVIYFLHGAGGNENSDAGGFSSFVSRLTEAKRISPAICVFPNGGMSGYQDRPATKILGETLIIKELIPLIDRTYRTQPTRESRVVAGFSMGGGGAIRLALKHPDLFSAAGSWAASLGSRGGEIPAELQAEHLRKLDGKVRLLMIVGDQDFTNASHKPFIENLEQAKYPHRYRVLEGVGHNLGLYHEKTADELVLFLAEGWK